MLCPIKNNSNTIELTVPTSCYWVLDLLCVTNNKTVRLKMHNDQWLTPLVEKHTIECAGVYVLLSLSVDTSTRIEFKQIYVYHKNLSFMAKRITIRKIYNL